MPLKVKRPSSATFASGRRADLQHGFSAVHR
jgi:hypothetical protein